MNNEDAMPEVAKELIESIAQHPVSTKARIESERAAARTMTPDQFTAKFGGERLDKNPYVVVAMQDGRTTHYWNALTMKYDGWNYANDAGGFSIKEEKK